tara:strand:+ start:429 stop:917 length:489 start_codon:yes stop_codon:yes gene_type:complete
MQAEYERVLKNLSILATASHNDKVNTNDDIFSIYVPTYSRGAMRLYYGEKRSNNITKIQDNIRMATSFVTKNMKEITSDLTDFNNAMIIQQSRRMLQALESSKEGLKNLQQTYKDDSATNTHIQILLREISDFLHILSNQNVSNLLHLQDRLFVTDVSNGAT